MIANPGPEPTENQRKHLDFIQAAIARMSSASSSAKSWLLPVVTATYGYALTKHADSISALGIVATVVFATLDVQYLRQERAFRALYRAAAAGVVPLYDMNNARYYRRPSRSGVDTRETSCKLLAVLRSWSITCFYIPLVVTGIIVTWRAH